MRRVSDIVGEIKRMSINEGVSLSEILDSIEKENKEQQIDKIKKEVELNSDLVGRCFYSLTDSFTNPMFPSMKKFFKVVSNRSENQYRVECLMFDEHPTYWFDYVSHRKCMCGDNYLGNFNFESFTTDSVMSSDIRKMSEITAEDFNNYAKKYLDELLSIEWIVDHYRYGNVFPTEDKWRCK